MRERKIKRMLSHQRSFDLAICETLFIPARLLIDS